MDEPIRHRARLSLRAERAVGLRGIVAGALLTGPPTGERGEALPSASAAATAGASSRRPAHVSRAPSPAQAPLAAVSDVFDDSDVLLARERLAVMPLDEPFAAPPLNSEEKRRRLIMLDEKEVHGCTRCRLCQTRTRTVFGDGDHDADVFFIGEGPGENEDLQGRPFVGRAGELLNKMIAAMGLSREQVYIANIVKCRPPENRAPAPDEVATCTPYLRRQLEIVRPRAIVTLGLPAAQYMLQSKLSMGRLRGKFQSWRGIQLMPTYHPAYVLRNYTDETRAAVWSDLKQVMSLIGSSPSRP